MAATATTATAAAAGDVETGGQQLPISGKQSTPTTTTAQAKKKQYTKVERIAYRFGFVTARLASIVWQGFLLLVLLTLAVAGVWCVYVGVAHISIGVAHLFSRCGMDWSWPRPYDPIEYTVTIAAVSGLDDLAEDLPHTPALWHRRRLDPAFNLTLGVASPTTAFGRDCLQAGTTVEVTYLGVPLATGPRTPELCVDVGERREESSVVAWGDGVRLPRIVLDSLAADVRRGEVEFGIRLTPPVPYSAASRPMMFFSTAVDVISCSAKAGGGPAPCRVSRETVSFPALPRPGIGRERDDYSEANNLPRPTTQERRDTS